jgi:RHS repeat-associated protein
VSLPGDLLYGLNSVTFEFWASFGVNGVWSRVYDFGDHDSSTGWGRHYVFFTPHSVVLDHRMVIGISDSNPPYADEQMVKSPGVLDGQMNLHMSCVYDPPNGVMSIYTNGVLESASPMTCSLKDVRNVFSWLGRSLYDVDAYLNGSIDEFRIYQRALTAVQIASSFAAGPDAPSSLKPLVVTQPRSQTVVAASDAVFSVLAYGDEPLSYQWRVNGTNLDGATTAKLVVTNVQADLSGSAYSVIVSNHLGLVTSYAAVLTVSPVDDVLIHRYSFTVDASDSVGHADGTLMNGASITNGKVLLNGAGAYVNLPGDLLYGLNSVTFEFWASFGVNGVWSRVYDFGDHDSSTGWGRRYVFFTPHSGVLDHRMGISISDSEPPGVNEQLVTVPGVLDGRIGLHVSCVYDPPNGVMSLYTNGVLESASPMTFSLKDVRNVFSWLGRSLYDVDAYLNGSIDEFRIYQTALTAPQIASSFAAGSDAPISRLSALVLSPLRSGTIVAGDTLRFSARATVPANRGPVTYFWSFGDGRFSTLEEPGIVNFPALGTDVVSVDVIDKLGYHVPAPGTRTFTVIPDTNSVPDLAATQLNVPGNLAIGQPAQITYTVRNAGDGSLSGPSWKDALYLSRDAYLDVNDQLLVSAAVSNVVAVGDSYTNTLTATLLAVEEGAYYLILSVNDEWQFLKRHRLNNEFAVATDLVIPRLTNAVPFAATFTGNGDEHYFRIDVSAGQNLLIQLNGLDNLGASEVYVRFGALPTRGTFDYRAATPGSADQQLLIPAAAPGTYYILVRGESAPGNGQFTLEAIASRLNVTGVTPDRYGQGASATLAIAGAGFDATAVAELVATNGTTYGATSVSVDSFTQLTATFNLSSVPVGRYSLSVSSPFWGTNTLADAFEVLPAGEARLETSLIVPSQLGYHAVATIWVEYRNTGNAAMSAPLLVLTATQNGREGAFLTLQQVGLVEGFWTSADPAGFSHSIQILASGDTPGVLQPGDSVRVPVYYAGWQQPWDFSYPPMNWNLGVLQANDTNAVNWAALKASMKPATINAEAWEVIWAGFTNQVGATWGDYVHMLDDNAAYLGRLSQRVVDVGQLLGFEFLQADGLSPLRTLASAVDAAVEAPGLPLVFSRSFPASISQRFELGPLGRGWSHNWQYSLSVTPDGTVTVLGPSASRRSFQPDSRYSGSYFAQPGDHATLTPLGGGAFTLREPAGLLRAFRADGKLDYVQDPNGNRITAGYSGNLLTSLTHSSGQRLTISYGAGGRVANITDHLGRQTILSYDGSGEHLLSAQYYDSRTATYEYQSLLTSAATHALTSVANSCCARRYFTYDAQGRLSSTYRDGNAEAVTFTYDSAGKVIATDALGGASKFYFDHRGLLVKTEDALGSAVHLAFDDYFNLARLTDPAGRSYGYAYDGNGNLTQSTDPLGHASRFTYHAALNRLASVTDANGNITRYAYTGSGNLQFITYADSSREGWSYDALGNATTWTNRRSRPISYAYDTNGQLTSKLFTDGSRAVYAYDPRGNLTNATTLDAQLSTLESSQLLYDSADRLTNITSTGGKWLAFTYDTAGRRASSLDQLGHRLTYSYDAVGRLESMTNELGELVVRYGYDPAGRLARKTLGNGLIATYGYDAAGQLLTLTNRLADGTAISWFNYAYDRRGRRTAMATHYGAWAYDYDDLGQLTRAVLSSTDPQISSQDLAYVYDALGSRIRTIENGVTTEYTANKLNQYVRVGQTNYVFDLDGNLVQEITPQGTNTFVYNDENRLIAVTQDASLWQYAYDALGSRVATTENGVTKRFVIDPIGLGNVVGEYDSAGNLLAHYDHGFGLLSRRDAAGDAAFYTFDAIGNVQQLVTSAGVIANAYAYSPYGPLIRRSETIPNPFQFVGQFGVMKEGNGLNFMRSRFFLASIGRFSAWDPIGFFGGLNPYSYVGDSPVSVVDPIGLCRDFTQDWEMALRARDRYPDDLQLRDLEHYLWTASQVQEAGRHGRFWQTAVSTYWVLMTGGYSGVKVIASPLRWTGLWPTTRPTWNEFWSGLAGTGEGQSESECNGPTYPSPNPEPNPPTVPTQPGGSGSSGSSGSTDPNHKTGPAGFGTNGFITASGTLAYLVDFENETNASAPAQQVVVTDQLNGSLDWSTFQLAEVGFGDQLIVVPPNAQHFETNVPVSYLGTNFQVQIEAGIQLYSGLVYANFRSIDPATSLPPPVNIGFLPPEDGTGRGQGHIGYTINAKPNLPTGAQIRNVAQISFDLLPSLATNQKDPHNPAAGTDPAKECINTIDSGAPTSFVTPLPAASPAAFQVQWFGQDDAGGSGVATYDIFVSTDGESFVPWLERTNGISAYFVGEQRHTYAFFSVARDNVGNQELPHSKADTFTVVVTNSPPVVLVSPIDQTATPGTDITFSVTAIGAAPLNYQWRFNGTDLLNGGRISGASSNILAITSVQMSDAGSYTVVITNVAGSVTSSPPAVLTLREPTPSGFVPGSIVSHSDGTFQFTLSSEPGSSLEIQASTNLADWVIVATLTNSTGTIPFTDAATNFSSRFYRARLLP